MNNYFKQLFVKASHGLLLTFISLFTGTVAVAQNAYFIDGFHGGVWGHYPVGYTKYMVDQLKSHPDWKINLEIEPETWDSVKVLDKESYHEFKSIFKDQSVKGRIEYVNPSYAQSYLFNISGESIIRQFSYGIKKLKSHFPHMVLTTYSSEEPCFTSALPQILKSFGFKYASLKNPNTCWGGYTRRFGGETVNWIGPDGTEILTVPRYEIESLKPNSTWETIANSNSEQFIKSAFDYGIEHPIGMCLQDAGWRNGPWLEKKKHYDPTIYTTWRNYFDNIIDKKNIPDWKLSQEDILASLVWGSQVLQRIAQEVRTAENKIIQAEKIATINYLDQGIAYPSSAFDQAWRTLLLSQHHDCWIVPYNNVKDEDTWADMVKKWTAYTSKKSDSIMNVLSAPSHDTAQFIKVYNTTALDRNEWVKTSLPKEWNVSETAIVNKEGKVVPSQVISSEDDNQAALLFKASVPSFGYQTFQLKRGKSRSFGGAKITALKNGNYQLETDLYKVILDTKHGGVIKHLIAKKIGRKDFVDPSSKRKFNQLRGNFYKKGGFHSSVEHPASVTILEDGPARIRVAVKGEIAGNPFTQLLTLAQGQKRIDLRVIINWTGNEAIGEFEETDYQSTTLHKAFYNDRYKLLTLFPLDLKNQKVHKNAPFDVTVSKLDNTFFSTWDSIKNNVILNWVDVTNQDETYGCALYTDHTTSYTHGTNFPLGLTIQYAGKGLWGRDYSINGPSEINYALIPHEGSWKQARLWSESQMINEPLHAILTTIKPGKEGWEKSFISKNKNGWVLSSSTIEDGNMLLRIFNAGGNSNNGILKLAFNAKNAKLIELNGGLIQQLPVRKYGSSDYELEMGMPTFGLRNIKIPE